MELHQGGARPRVEPVIVWSGLTRVTEHGSVSARLGRAICKALRENATLFKLQRKQDAGSELFWRAAPEQQIADVVKSGMVSSELMHENAANWIVDRDLESALEALDDGGLLGDQGRRQALFNRAVGAGRSRTRAWRSARLLLTRYRDINPAVDNSRAFIGFSGTGDAATVQMLLADGRVNPATARHAASRLASTGGHVEVVKLLLADARVNPRVADLAAIHAEGNFNDGVNAEDSDGWPSVMLAAEAGHAEVVQLLLANGARMNRNNTYGMTTLHFAAIEGHADVVEVLLANGADVNAKNCGQQTALHPASWMGHKAVVAHLLANGADANARDTVEGRTPLHLAAKFGHKSVVEVLVSHGADVNVRNDCQQTALHIAERKGHAAVVELLSQAGARM